MSEYNTLEKPFIKTVTLTASRRLVWYKWHKHKGGRDVPIGINVRCCRIAVLCFGFSKIRWQGPRGCIFWCLGRKTIAAPARAANAHLPNIVQLHKSILTDKATSGDAQRQELIKAEFVKSAILSFPYSHYRTTFKKKSVRIRSCF